LEAVMLTLCDFGKFRMLPESADYAARLDLPLYRVQQLLHIHAIEV
jgi:hypothetical protein